MRDNPFSGKHNPWKRSYPYYFEAVLERFGVGKNRVIWYNVLFLNEGLRKKLPFDEFPRLRVEGTIANIPVENAFIPSGDGRYYVIVSPRVINDARIAIGESVEMCFRVADQNKVDIPEILEAAINEDRDTKRLWSDLSPGKQRMLCQHVKSAKSETTQAKRLGEALEILIDFNADIKIWRDLRKK
ncbi:MAG: YdeI/OmpD-associated family protein [Verrucomicrobiota bacterium]